VGDLVGVLVVAPPLLVLVSTPRARIGRARMIEAALVSLAIIITTQLAFQQWRATAAQTLGFTYLLFPLLMWAGLRFEQVGVTTAALFSCGMAVAGAVRGFGPFTYATLYSSLLYMQAFMGVVVLTGLFLGAVTAERRRAREALARERNELSAAKLEAQRHAARVQLLADASQTYAQASLDLPRSLATIARQIGEAIGDACVIGLLTSDGEKLETPAVHHPDREARRLLSESTLTPWPADRPPLREVLREGAALLIPDTSIDPRIRPLFELHGNFLDRFPPHSLLAVPLRCHSKVIGLIAVGREAGEQPYTHDDKLLLCDIGERAALAIDNARLFQQAQESVRVRDDFLAVASHELRTPLSASVLQLAGLRRVIEAEPATPFTAGLLARLDRAMRANDRLTKLVDSLLDVSRIATRRFALHREPSDLAQIARETVTRAQPEALAGHCELRLSAEPTVTGYWDRGRLEQVLGNLLSNAIKYGQGKPIEIEVHGDDERALLSVRDYGIGIAKADVERIFMRFERAVSVRNYGGLGLGLYLARQIVEAHGGVLKVASDLQAGAAFALELPRWPPTPEVAAPQVEQRV
jgi:signal transduction histidine kinase